MILATTLRYCDLNEKNFGLRHYICLPFAAMAEKYGFGLCAVMNETELEKVCDQCDGLLLPGSATNIDPSYYGGEPLETPEPVDEYALDSKLIEYFEKRNKPIFGFCGGLQALNVYFGGTLSKLSDPEAHKNYDKNRHDIIIKKDSFVYDVFGAERAEVNCFHGWQADKMAPVFDVVARTEDGTVEAFECREKHIFATQWHPERSLIDFEWENEIEQKFFENFVALCEKVKEEQK